MEAPGERNGAAEALDFIKIYMVVIWAHLGIMLESFDPIWGQRNGCNRFYLCQPTPGTGLLIISSVAIWAQEGAIFRHDGSTTSKPQQLRIYSYVLGAADTTTADEYTTRTG